MELTISITGGDGRVKASAQGIDSVTLVYSAPYDEGDTIRLSGDSCGHVLVKLEDCLDETLGYLNGEFRLVVPFGRKRAGYSPKAFTGNIHLLWAKEGPHESAMMPLVNEALLFVGIDEKITMHPSKKQGRAQNLNMDMRIVKDISQQNISFLQRYPAQGRSPIRSWRCGKCRR